MSPQAPLAAAFALALATPAISQDAALVPADLLAAAGDLEVTVWAQSPQLRNPTNMDIDAAGRIWVAEGVNYRFSKGRDPKGDRIAVLEDTDGDGRADKSWTFVQEPELVAPLGVAVIDNRIYVSNAPDLIVYTDVDRDLRFDPAIDTREVLLTGFNGVNHDHALHSVTFGPDGLLYFNHGNSGALVTDRSGRTFRVGSAYDGKMSGDTIPLYGILPIEYAGARSDDGHVYVGGFAMRMRPDGTRLEPIGFGFRNSYEQTVTSFGDIFQNDNDDPPACRTSYLLEYGNAGWFSRDGARFWPADRRPGQDIPTSQWRQQDPGVMPSGDVYGAGAPTGIVFYEGDALGDDTRGLLLSCEAARNTIFGYKPRPEGAGFALERFHFLTSNEEQQLAGTDALQGKTSSEMQTFFRPSDVSVGPDGAIYVADWFDPRVGGHSDLDKTASGAIYRIAPKGFVPRVPVLDLETAAGQIEALKSPAINVRALGFVPLQAAGERAIAPVAALLDDPNPYIRGRAIWLLAQLGPKGVARVEKLLASKDAQTRATGYQALRRVDADILQHARKLAKDPSPAVRREVAVSLRDIPFAECKDIIVSLARGYDGADRSYLEAWGIACIGKEAEAFEAIRKAFGQADPLAWTPAYAGLVWRLTPEAAVADFARRALSSELGEGARLDAVTAVGFVPSQGAADALWQMLDGSDGNVREHARWWLMNYRSTRWNEFGVPAELKRRGIYDPDTIVVSSSVILKPEPSAMIAPESVAGLAGDAARGAQLAAACYVCHKMGDQGAEYGPDLNGWAGRQSTEAAILAIVNPSADIAHGFDGREVILKDGAVVHGMIESENDPMVVRSMGGVRQLVPKERIDRVNWYGRSLMLSADQMGLDAQAVADVVAFLKTL